MFLERLRDVQVANESIDPNFKHLSLREQLQALVEEVPHPG